MGGRLYNAGGGTPAGIARKIHNDQWEAVSALLARVFNWELIFIGGRAHVASPRDVNQCVRPAATARDVTSTRGLSKRPEKGTKLNLGWGLTKF